MYVHTIEQSVIKIAFFLKNSIWKLHDPAKVESLTCPWLPIHLLKTVLPWVGRSKACVSEREREKFHSLTPLAFLVAGLLPSCEAEMASSALVASWTLPSTLLPFLWIDLAHNASAISFACWDKIIIVIFAKFGLSELPFLLLLLMLLCWMSLSSLLPMWRYWIIQNSSSIQDQGGHGSCSVNAALVGTDPVSVCGPCGKRGKETELQFRTFRA